MSGPSDRGAGAALGFTLVELLIALALIGIITILLFSGLRLGSRSWEAVETASERVADLRVARNFIENSLRQTRDASVVVDGVELPVFTGEPQAIEWVAPLSEHVGIPGLYVLRLSLEDAGEYPRLVLRRWLLQTDVLEGGDDYPPWQPLVDAAGSAEDAGPLDRDVAGGAYGRTVLLPAVASFALQYFGRLEGEQQGEWFEEWLQQPRLPARVRLDVTTPVQSWPATVMELPGEPMAGNGLP